MLYEVITLIDISFRWDGDAGLTFAGAETKTPARFAPAGVCEVFGFGLCFAYLLLPLDGARGTTTRTTSTTRTTGTARIEMTSAIDASAATRKETVAIRSSAGISVIQKSAFV